MTLKRTQGFTLIELLIVVAILGILGSILFVAIGTNPQRDARDSRRISDVNQLQLALELYKNANDAYPTSLAALAPTYIGAAPQDPKTGVAYSYAYNPATSPTNYHLGATLENASNKALCNDADYNSSATGGAYTGGFLGGASGGPTACGGAATGDSATSPVFDLKS